MPLKRHIYHNLISHELSGCIILHSNSIFLVQHIICVSQHPFSSGSPQVVDIALVRDSAWMSWFNCWTAITHSLRGFFTMPCAIRFEDKLLSEGFCKAPTTILTFDVIPRVFWQRRSSLQYCLYTSWIQPSNSSQLCTKKTARKSSTTILFETGTWVSSQRFWG